MNRYQGSVKNLASIDQATIKSLMKPMLRSIEYRLNESPSLHFLLLLIHNSLPTLSRTITIRGKFST